MRDALVRTVLLTAPAVCGTAGLGCRSAVVVGPNDPHTQTVVTVERRPTTSPSDKHLIVRDRGSVPASQPATDTAN